MQFITAYFTQRPEDRVLKNTVPSRALICSRSERGWLPWSPAHRMYIVDRRVSCQDCVIELRAVVTVPDQSSTENGPNQALTMRIIKPSANSNFRGQNLRATIEIGREQPHTMHLHFDPTTDGGLVCSEKLPGDYTDDSLMYVDFEFVEKAADPELVDRIEVQQLLDDADPLRLLHSTIRGRTEPTGMASGRITLISSDQQMFHVHCIVMKLHSTELKRMIDGNLRGVRDGVPLRFDCSSVALHVLLRIVYLCEIDDNFDTVFHEICKVACEWKLEKILDICCAHRTNTRKLSTPTAAESQLQVDLQKLVTESSVLRPLYDELKVQPAQMDAAGGRLTLRSRENEVAEHGPQEFHVHCDFMKLHSLELKRFIDGNLDSVRDGVPLRFACSSLALGALLKLIYLQKIDDNFDVVLHEIVKVAHMWKMNKILYICSTHMKNGYKDQTDFEVLLSWFVAAEKYELGMEREILEVLFGMVVNNREQFERLMHGAAEYIRGLSNEDAVDLMTTIRFMS